MRARQGLAAGVSTTLAVGAGILTNVATSGWTWSLGAGLVVLVGVWIGFEVWRAGPDDRQHAAASASRFSQRIRDSATSQPGAEDDSTLAQLPVDTASFTGRVEEINQLLRTLDEGAEGPSGVVVICAVDGMAGIGKTTLAVHVAHRLTSGFSDGCLFLDLHGYTDGVSPVEPGQALQRLLRAIGVPGEAIPAEVDDQAALYRSRLVGKQMLIVLDNARTSEQVRPLLPASAGCLVLVTSRRRLTALDEARPLSLDVLPADDAVALFSRVAGSGRVVADPEAVHRIVDLCGRLPLALRIAAARLRARPTWTVAHLAHRLSDQHGFLDEFDDGERSVIAALALSYSDLTDDQRVMFRRAGLHPGADIEPYAAAALADVEPATASRLLEHLLDAHLLIQALPSRYQFHDLVRSYAARLSRADDSEQVRQSALNRLFDYYLSAAAAAMDSLYPAERHHRPRGVRAAPPVPPMADPAAALAWLDAERSNAVAVCTYAAAHGWPAHVVRLSATLARYLYHGGHYADGLAIHTYAWQLARDAGDQAAAATALTHLGRIHSGQGRSELVAEELQQALAIFREIDDKVGQARALNNLGFHYWRSGPFTRAADYLQQALTLFQQLEDLAGEVNALDGLGLVRERQGRDPEAAEHFQRAVALCRQIGDRAGEAGALDSLGYIASRQGHHQQAIDHHQRSLALCRAIGSRLGEGSALSGLGLAYRRRGQHHHAIGHHQQALTISRQIGDRAGELHSLNGLGEALQAAGQPERAQAEHTCALTLAAETGDRYEQARALTGLGHIHNTTGDHEQARENWHQALAIYTNLGVPEAAEIHAHLTTLNDPGSETRRTTGTPPDS